MAERALVEVSSPVSGDQAEDLPDQARQQADERNKCVCSCTTACSSNALVMQAKVMLQQPLPGQDDNSLL